MQMDWYRQQAVDLVRKAYVKATGKRLMSNRYAGRIVLNEDEGSALLNCQVQSGRPLMACRYGFVELEIMAAVYRYFADGSRAMFNQAIKKGDIFNNAGFFPHDRQLVLKFGELMLECSKKVDMCGIWFIPYEEYFLKKTALDAVLVPLRTYEPWNEKEPWTSSLAGKKVLVVHPFSQTIKCQYQKREQLFENQEMLPKFELKTYKAVQTIAGNNDSRFANWFEALDFMTDEIVAMDFDIAILGCGAYGMPLAARIKDAGRQAVHIGGATQLLFGIKGKRWDTHPVVSKLYNEAWVRPGLDERPEGLKKVEGGCYW